MKNHTVLGDELALIKNVWEKIFRLKCQTVAAPADDVMAPFRKLSVSCQNGEHIDSMFHIFNIFLKTNQIKRPLINKQNQLNGTKEITANC